VPVLVRGDPADLDVYLISASGKKMWIAQLARVVGRTASRSGAGTGELRNFSGGTVRYVVRKALH